MPLLDDFRKQHPEYDKVPDGKLLPALYDKYYADKMDKPSFINKVYAFDKAKDKPVWDPRGIGEGAVGVAKTLANGVANMPAAVIGAAGRGAAMPALSSLGIDPSYGLATAAQDALTVHPFDASGPEQEAAMAGTETVFSAPGRAAGKFGGPRAEQQVNDTLTLAGLLAPAKLAPKASILSPKPKAAGILHGATVFAVKKGLQALGLPASIINVVDAAAQIGRVGRDAPKEVPKPPAPKEVNAAAMAADRAMTADRLARARQLEEGKVNPPSTDAPLTDLTLDQPVRRPPGLDEVVPPLRPSEPLTDLILSGPRRPRGGLDDVVETIAPLPEPPPNLLSGMDPITAPLLDAGFLEKAFMLPPKTKAKTAPKAEPKVEAKAKPKAKPKTVKQTTAELLDASIEMMNLMKKYGYTREQAIEAMAGARGPIQKKMKPILGKPPIVARNPPWPE